MSIYPESHDELLLNVKDELYKKYGVVPNIGFELEFYLLDPNSKPISDGMVSDFKQQLSEYGVILEEEKGNGQFEVQLPSSFNIIGLIKKFYDLKKNIANFASSSGCNAIFSPKPFEHDYGSAMHVHLSLHDSSRKNVFSTDDIASNLFLTKTIYGALDLLPESMAYYLKEEDFTRYVPKSLAPTTVSWGGNNRSTAIRVPESKPEFRRIEFRIPSASSPFEKVVAYLLISAYHGLITEGLYFPRIFGNAFDDQYSLKPLPKELKEAEEIYNSRLLLKKYIEEFKNKE